MTSRTVEEISFRSHGAQCAAWHVHATSDDMNRNGLRPVVVIGHGFGGTRDTGLMDFAAGFADAGVDSLVFDYRGFGASEGSPRQVVAYRKQRQDWRAAVEAARRLRGVDPDRVALWGTSYSGGHVLTVAAADPRIAAVIALAPATDGLAAVLQIARTAGPLAVLRLVGHGLRDALTVITGGPPHRIPLAAEPGSVAIISTPGALSGYLAVAGPTWRNEVCARTALEVALNRPTTVAPKIKCPMLIQIGTNDQVAPPAAARKTADRAGGPTTVLEYPVDHFDAYTGPWQETVLADEVSFLVRALADTR
ncbi:alpha/beta hydrolase [[Mycobacterium] vasticus]|uniref:Alpha/beta fold hydrolase n=1 Tax=[Mycobacterium] vasticus TaxID=2875777 RepID=A0ABU5YZY9_9MYCO|nr:alpha/beta fold hydrolase [Mycolicibacter sp. MYC017]MEB3070460.1 alpha/beta fold hydrolase [Mycolicibacter sp. MYC017]